MADQSDLLSVINKAVEQMEKENGIVRVPAPRDWVPCCWCGGSCASYGLGCAACFNARQQKLKELDEEYKRQFPDGPKPFFTADMTTPEGIESAKRVIGREAIEKAFGPNGGGVQEIMDNAKREQGNG